MASDMILQRLKQRADLADRLTVELRYKIEQLKQAAVSTGCGAEEDKLRQENLILKAEIENVKLHLTLAEIQNGVKQVFLPYQKPSTPANGACTDALNTPPPQTEPINQSVSKTTAKTDKKQAVQNGESNEGKPAKETKPKKENKPKPSSAVDERMDISRLDIRVGKIVDVKKHPDADSLYIEDVDIGEDKTRTVVSGLVKHVPLDQMKNRLALFMCNLKPQKMRGVLSEGMIMCASTTEKVEILVPPSGVNVGDKVTFKDFPGIPDPQLNPKKKIWETLKPDVRTNQTKVATYKGCPFVVEGKGEVTAPTLADAQIS